MKLPDVSGNKKIYLYVGGAAAVYIGYRYWKNQSNAAALTPVEATTDTSSVTDTAGGAYGPGNTQYAGTGDINGTPATNADWTNNAVQMMSNYGWDPATVAAALGKYLGAIALTDAEITIVRTALGLAGSPPVGSFTIIHAPTQVPTPSTPATAYTILDLGKLTESQHDILATKPVGYWATFFGTSTTTLKRLNPKADFNHLIQIQSLKVPTKTLNPALAKQLG